MSSPLRMALMSSLNCSTQRGGAFLRVDALTKIYEKLGFSVTIFYMEQWNPRRTIKAEFARVLYKEDVRVLFSKETVDLRGFDVIHYDNLRFFQWNILKDKNSFLIYNAHNLEFESYYSRDLHTGHWCKRFKRYEVKSVLSADLTLVCSDRERNVLIDADVPADKVFTIPNLVDKSFYKTSLNKKTILFLGTLDYYPNIRAVDFLCLEFFPNLPQQILEKYHFVIAGRNPGTEMSKKVASLGVTLRENLSQEEIYELLSETLISLVPLDHGSGTRLKIVESLFSGAAILSTHLGAEGFEGSPGLTTCELDEFTNRFIELITDTDNLAFLLDSEFISNNDTNSWIDSHIDNLGKVILGKGHE